MWSSHHWWVQEFLQFQIFCSASASSPKNQMARISEHNTLTKTALRQRLRMSMMPWQDSKITTASLQWNEWIMMAINMHQHLICDVMSKYTVQSQTLAYCILCSSCHRAIDAISLQWSYFVSISIPLYLWKNNPLEALRKGFRKIIKNK